MQQHFARVTGPGAGVIKYDIITALSVMALHGGPTLQTTALRLIAVLTARYNWKLDQFCMAQSEMARLWDVSDRTVKREVKRMVAGGLIRCLRPGVRGRAGAYQINYPQLFEQSQTSWHAVGPDFESRMQATPQAPAAKVVKVDFGQISPPVLPAGLEATDTWSRVLQDLAVSDPANLNNWYMKLRLHSEDAQTLRVTAPSRFVASFVETHLAGALARAVARVRGHPVKVLVLQS